MSSNQQKSRSMSSSTADYGILLTRNLDPEEILNIVGFGRFQIKLLVIVGLRIFAHGSSFALMAVVSSSLQCEWHLTDFEKASLAASFFAGFGIGSFLLGFLADKYGRRRTMFFSFSLSCCYSALSAFSHNFWWMLILRFKYGIFVGGVSLGYLFIIEFLPAKYRRVVTFMDFFFALGIATVALLGATVLRRLEWRYFILSAETLPLFLASAFAIIIPESPRHLIASGKFTEAEDVFKLFAKQNGTDGFDVRLRVKNRDSPRSVKKQGLVKQIFSWRHFLNTLSFVSIWFAISLGQIGTLYLTTEFSHIQSNPCHRGILGSQSNSKYFSTTKLKCSTCKRLLLKDYMNLLVTGLGGIPGVLLTFCTIEALGRKSTARVLLFVILIFSWLLFLCLPNWTLTLVFVVIYTCGYSSHLVLQVYVSETYPTYLRGVANGFIKIFSRLGHIAGTFYAQFFIREKYVIALTVFCILHFTALMLTLLLKNETKGEPLEDVEDDDGDQ